MLRDNPNMSYMKKNMSKQLADIFGIKGIPLLSIGVDDYAFGREDALEFIKRLQEKSILILGGDVLAYHGDKIEYTYDNWSYEAAKDVTWEQAVQNAYLVSKRYIENYPPEREQVLFEISCDTKEHYEGQQYHLVDESEGQLINERLASQRGTFDFRNKTIRIIGSTNPHDWDDRTRLIVYSPQEAQRFGVDALISANQL